MDFRNVTRLFADPDWDGPIEQEDGYGKEGIGAANSSDVNPPGSDTEPKEKPIVDANGCKVEIIGKIVSVYDANGKLLRQESIIDYTSQIFSAHTPLLIISSAVGVLRRRKKTLGPCSWSVGSTWKT